MYSTVKMHTHFKVLMLPPAAGVVTSIEAPSCCVVTWKPPQDTGGEQPGYAVRFFDGENYDSSQSKVTFEYYDDPDRYWAKWDDCPTDRIIYAEVRHISFVYLHQLAMPHCLKYTCS